MTANPQTESLAAALSVAVRVEPELICAVRLEVLPTLDVGCEADLWFSPMVAVREPQSIVLKHEVRQNLHRKLGTMLMAAHDHDPIKQLWQVISRVHAGISPALLLEEHITWLAISRGSDATDRNNAELQTALEAVVVQKRNGVAEWFAGAWSRLPRRSAEPRRELGSFDRQVAPSALLPSHWPHNQVRRSDWRISPTWSTSSPTSSCTSIAITAHCELVPWHPGPAHTRSSCPTRNRGSSRLRRCRSPRPCRPPRFRSRATKPPRSPSVPASCRLRTGRGMVYEIPMADTQSRSRIFLSYTRNDLGYARALKQWLLDREATSHIDDVYLDTDSLRAGSGGRMRCSPLFDTANS